MVFEKIFRTESGSIYLRDSETGIWKRDNRGSEKYYLGSFDDKEARVCDGEYVNRIKINEYLIGGLFPGFVPDFVIGNHPLGLITEPDNIKEVSNGMVRVGDICGMQTHVGHKILEVYKKLPSWAEQRIA